MANDKHCLAPWTHTYLSPQSERRLCCASREPSHVFKQYIDKNPAVGDITKEAALDLLKNRNKYNPQTLEEHWNSDHMKSVRQRMMDGKSLPECEVCDKKLLNTSVYKDYFDAMFDHKRDSLLAATDADGTHHGLPISFDYRLKNTCSFKCRMCGPMLSSAWEAEARRFSPDIVKHETWMAQPNRSAIRQFQEGQATDELWDAIKSRRIEEIYWVGGEPMDWPEHWEMMVYMVEHDIAKDVYVRYNTNLSKIDYKGTNIFDLLPKFKDWQICASLDGVGEIGEYIRTGLDYNKWHQNFSVGKKASKHIRQMRIDLTLTLPGLVDFRGIQQLVNEFDVGLLTKITFAFSPDIIMSPMCLPRRLLNDAIDAILDNCAADSRTDSLVSVLKNMKELPNFQEQWPEEYLVGLQQGKARILELESRRKHSYTMSDILKYRPEIGEWWDGI